MTSEECYRVIELSIVYHLELVTACSENQCGFQLDKHLSVSYSLHGLFNNNGDLAKVSISLISSANHLFNNPLAR
jgi:hypothetical protein